MAYLTEQQLQALSFKKLGKNVQISDKASIYNPESIEIGDNSRIDDFCVVSGKIRLGSYIHIAALCLLAGGTEGIVVEDFSGIAYGSKVFSQADDYSGESMVSSLIPDEYKKVKKLKVHIGRHVIIGSSAVIFPGVHLAEGCSIGAMSLVTKSTEPWGIYTGIPAKRTKDKKKQILALEKKFLKKRTE